MCFQNASCSCSIITFCALKTPLFSVYRNYVWFKTCTLRRCISAFIAFKEPIVFMYPNHMMLQITPIRCSIRTVYELKTLFLSTRCIWISLGVFSGKFEPSIKICMARKGLGSFWELEHSRRFIELFIFTNWIKII